MAQKYDWDKIKKDYITGNFTYDELCEKYEIKRHKTLEERAAAEKWVDLRGKYRGEKEQKELEEIARKNAKKAARDEACVDKACNKLLKRIAEMAEKINKPGDIKSLTSALIDIHKMKGIKSEGDKREQQARINALLSSVEKNATGGPQTVNVVITGAEEYAD